MSDAEPDEPRFQGSDDDEFVSAMPEVVYGQDDGEEMAQKITTLEADITWAKAEFRAEQILHASTKKRLTDVEAENKRLTEENEELRKDLQASQLQEQEGG